MSAPPPARPSPSTPRGRRALAITAISDDTGTAGDFITSERRRRSAALHGALGAGEKIQVSADGGTTWVDATPSGSNWSASGVTLSAGTHTLLVRSIDAAANITPGTGHSYTLAPPPVVITTIVTPNGYDMHGLYGDIAGSSDVRLAPLTTLRILTRSMPGPAIPSIWSAQA